MKHAMMTVLLGAMAAVALPASAQFDRLMKSDSKSESSAGITADDLVKRYVSGARTVLKANYSMLDAVGLKTEAAIASAQASNLTEGATKESLEATSKVQTDSSKALEARLADGSTKMDAASKKRFAAGVVDLAKGVITYVSLGRDAKGFKPGMRDMGSAGGAVYVASSLPSSTSNLANTLKLAIDFCKSNQIPVPKEANDATSMI